MSDVSLFDPLTPYFFAGIDLGAGVHDILALLHIDELDAAWDDDGVVLWGVARIDSDDPNSFLFSPRAGGGPVARGPDNRPLPDAEVWEWHDVSVRFRLTVARQATAVLPPAEVSDTSLRALLEAFGATTAGARSDYPGTQFRLELLLSLATITLPRLRGARLEPNGLLVEDPANPRVKLKIPRLLLIVTQGSTGPDTPFQVDVGSFGASGLDGQSQEIADLLTMDPPYALLGSDRVFGFGFRSLVLDLDDSQTPPQLLEKFGVGEDWQGVYLPEVRIFIAPNGLTGFAVNAGVKELLIGIRDTPGVWGDFMVDVINQGAQLQVTPRFVGPWGAPVRLIEIDRDAAARRDEYLALSVPDETSMLIDVQSGAAPYTIKALLGLTPGHAVPSDDEFDGPGALDLSVSQRHEIAAVAQTLALRVTSRNPSQRRIVIIEVSPSAPARGLPASTTTHGPTPAAVLSVSGAPSTHRVTLENAAQELVTLRFDPASGASLEVDGDPVTVTDGAAVVRVPPGGTAQPLHLAIAWTPETPRPPVRFDGYFAYDSPARTDTSPTYPRPAGEDPPLMRDAPAPGGTDAATSARLTDFLAQRPAGVPIRVDAFTSFEGHGNPVYNEHLSQRRANALANLIRTRISDPENVSTYYYGYDGHPRLTSGLTTEMRTQVTSDTDERLNQTGEQLAQRGDDPAYAWRATASYTRDGDVSVTRATGTLQRPAPSSETTVRRPEDVRPPQSNRPDFLREIGATVRILQSEFVALELRGKVDFHTASERGLDQFRAHSGDVPTPALPARTNPEDGVVDFRFNLSHDDTTDTWTERLVVQAGAGDRDGLFALGSVPGPGAGDPPPSSLSVPRDLLGLYFAIAPLASEVARGEPDAGDIVALAVLLSLPPALVALNMVRVLQFTLYGVEVALKHHGAFRDGKLAVLFDVESAIWLNLKLGTFRIITCRPDKPVRVRYKAVGFTINAGFDGSGPFEPVFDASRGYTIDLADSGSLKVLPDLPSTVGEIIQILGARIARTNPLNLEVELALGVDLGVFKLERFGFRLPIDPLGAPTLTALAISVDIPNTIKGTGRLEMNDTGFAGQIDISLPAVKLRIAAGLGIANLEDEETGRTATGLYLSMRVELPTGIPLGGTGFGIFGFLGLFAMHYKRKEPQGTNDKALRWLKDVVQGDPTNILGWGPNIDSWAFGGGLLLGTLEGAYVVRMTGMLVLELPGPRLIFFLRADLLNTKPAKGVKSESGTLLAALDMDFGAGKLTIGIQLDYKIKPVLEIMVPVEGYFEVERPENFYIDIGSIDRPITAKVLELFKATAYMMIHGNGIPQFPLGPLQGFSVAAGFHVSLEWGVKEINFYLEVAAGFDAGIGFAPFFLAGRVYLRGALHLFIIAIEARGELELQYDGADTWMHGEICGKIDLFFFQIEGCVSFELGTKPGTPHAPSLVRGLALQSRSPALIRGSGVDRGIDTVLARGTTDGSVPTTDGEDGAPRPVYVPIDAIPLIQFEVAPGLDPTFTIEGPLVGALPGGEDGWQKRGQLLVRYRLRAIKLSSDGPDGVGPGDRPNTWRQVPGSDSGDAPPIDLAMLDWSPDAAPRAFEVSDGRDTTIDDRYRRLCKPAAAAAPVMWSFHNARPGDSPVGWSLTGEPWPDAPGTFRTTPVPVGLTVREIWRTGDMLEALRSVVPARVIGTAVPCPPQPQRPPRPLGKLPLRAPVNPKLREIARPSLAVEPQAAEDLLVERTTPLKAASPAREIVSKRLLADVAPAQAKPIVVDKPAIDRDLLIAQLQDKQLRDRKLFDQQLYESQLVERQALDRQLTDKHVGEKQALDGQLADKQAIEKQALDKQLLAQEALDRQAAEKQLLAQQTAEKQPVDKALLGKPIFGKQILDKRAIFEKQVLDKQVLDKQVADKGVLFDKAILDKQALARQALERQLVDAQLLDRQAREKQLADQQALERQALEQKLADQQAADRQRREQQFLDDQKLERVALEKQLAQQAAQPVAQPGKSGPQPAGGARPADRSAPVRMTTASPIAQGDQRPACAGRVLIAPFEPLGLDRMPPGHQTTGFFAQLQAKALADVVRFEGGPFRAFRIYAMLRGKLQLAGHYDAEAFDADGNRLELQLRVTRIGALTDLPPAWRDPLGPWFDDTWLASALMQLVRHSGDLIPMIIDITLPVPASVIDFGVRDLPVAFAEFAFRYPAFVVGGMEGLVESERRRAEDDAREAEADADGLAKSLAADPAHRALLVPGRRYDVSVEYTAEVGERRADGIHVVRAAESFAQTHTFYTDAEPPAHLDPWLLCQFPAPDEQHHFYADPIILVFGTDDVTQLFGAYHRDLRGVVRDASFRPPQGDPARDAASALLRGDVMQRLGGVVFTPWEQTVRRRVGDRPCRDFNPDSPRHERAVLGLHMEPSTEYVFDVEAPDKTTGQVPRPPPPAPPFVHPLYRQSLATSRYADRQAMAADVHGSYIGARRLGAPAPLLALPDLATDQAFDAALIAAGLGVGEPAREPRITVLWLDGAPSTPAAIFLETPEPLWRTRKIPEPERDAAGRVTAWTLVERQWLGVEELVAAGGGVPGQHRIADLKFVRRTTGTRRVAAPTLLQLRDAALRPPVAPQPSLGVAAGALVQRFVRDASGCRTLAVLGPNARGRTVSFGLVRTLHPLIDPDAFDDPVPMLDVFLERAPWEVSP